MILLTKQGMFILDMAKTSDKLQSFEDMYVLVKIAEYLKRNDSAEEVKLLARMIYILGIMDGAHNFEVMQDHLFRSMFIKRELVWKIWNNNLELLNVFRAKNLLSGKGWTYSEFYELIG